MLIQRQADTLTTWEYSGLGLIEYFKSKWIVATKLLPLPLKVESPSTAPRQLRESRSDTKKSIEFGKRLPRRARSSFGQLRGRKWELRCQKLIT